MIEHGIDLTLTEAAQYLNLSAERLKKMCTRRGSIVHREEEGELYFPLANLHAYKSHRDAHV